MDNKLTPTSVLQYCQEAGYQAQIISIKLSSINIPRLYRETPPSKERIFKAKVAKNYSTILLDGSNMLLDGYITYLCMKEDNVNTVCAVKILSGCKPGDRSYLSHISHSTPPPEHLLNGKGGDWTQPKLGKTYTCYICGRVVKKDGSNNMDSLTIDHYIPKALGGDGSHKNLRICCKRCNGLKADNMPTPEFLDKVKVYSLAGMDSLIKPLTYTPSTTPVTKKASVKMSPKIDNFVHFVAGKKAIKVCDGPDFAKFVGMLSQHKMESALNGHVKYKDWKKIAGIDNSVNSYELIFEYDADTGLRLSDNNAKWSPDKTIVASEV